MTRQCVLLAVGLLLCWSFCLATPSIFGRRQGPITTTVDTVSGPTTSNSPTTTTVDTVSSPTTSSNETCADLLDNCISYGPKGCFQYQSWASVRCRKYCGFCTDPNEVRECKDKITNCNEYQADMCTAETYRVFAEQYCRLFCNKCTPPAALLNVTVTTLPITTKPGVSSGPGNGSDCDDTIADCNGYDDVKCFGVYEPWARAHCALRCGYCPGKFYPCVDVEPNCDEFADDACTSYPSWGRKNCRKRCNLCSPPVYVKVTGIPGVEIVSPASQDPKKSTPGTATTGGGATPTGKATTAGGSASGSSSMPSTDVPQPLNSSYIASKLTIVVEGNPSSVDGTCEYKGNNYAEGRSWYDGCQYQCNCIIAAVNRVICVDRCPRWTLKDNDLQGCNLVQEEGECCQRLECTKPSS